MSNVTMRRIAEVVGVSQTTVSFVLNERERANGSISPDTKQRVQDVARELGYQPNRAARALATGRSHLIGLCVRRLGLPHYAHVIQCAEDEISSSPFHLLVSRWDNDFTLQNARGLEGIFPWPMGGVLALEANEVLQQHWQKYHSWPAPIVSIGGSSYLVDNLDCVGVDLAHGVRQAVRHLHEIGCRSIAFASQKDTFQENEIRATAYSKTMQQLGKKPEYIELPDSSRAAAHKELKNFVSAQNCPDGILCFNDEVAMGIYRALCEMKINVPRDVALIGCDGIRDTEYLECPLSTIIQPVEEVCSIAWQMLQQRIENPQRETQHQLLVPQLAVRNSTLFFERKGK